MQFLIPYPDSKVLRKPPALVSGNPTLYPFAGADYPKAGGILVFKQGLLQPTKGFVFPEALVAINILKKVLKQTNIFNLVFFKKWLINFAELAEVVTTQEPLNCALKTEYLCDTAKELRSFLLYFLGALGYTYEATERVINALVLILEYDNAYRYYFQDICNSITATELLETPHKTLKRIALFVQIRAHTAKLQREIKLFTRILSWLLYIPKVKKAFKLALVLIDFKKLQFDTIDYYNILFRGDYNFLGRTWEDRSAELQAMHKQANVAITEFKLE